MRKFIPLLFVFIFSVCISAQSGSVENSIRDVMNKQVNDWNRGDIDAFMTGYWKSEKLTFISGDKVTRGWQQTLDNYKRTYATRQLMGKLSFSDLEFTIISKDAAVVLGSWSLAREKDNPHGKFTLLFRKFKDGWKIVQDHTS
ncbi:MAG: YybH family protein [Pyrinomonadaceae bacterium]